MLNCKVLHNCSNIYFSIVLCAPFVKLKYINSTLKDEDPLKGMICNCFVKMYLVSMIIVTNSTHDAFSACMHVCIRIVCKRDTFNNCLEISRLLFGCSMLSTEHLLYRVKIKGCEYMKMKKKDISEQASHRWAAGDRGSDRGEPLLNWTSMAATLPTPSNGKTVAFCETPQWFREIVSVC